MCLVSLQENNCEPENSMTEETITSRIHFAEISNLLSIIDEGEIYKVIWLPTQRRAKILAIYKPFSTPTKVWSMVKNVSKIADE